MVHTAAAVPESQLHTIKALLHADCRLLEEGPGSLQHAILDAILDRISRCVRYLPDICPT